MQALGQTGKEGALRVQYIEQLEQRKLRSRGSVNRRRKPGPKSRNCGRRSTPSSRRWDSVPSVAPDRGQAVPQSCPLPSRGPAARGGQGGGLRQPASIRRYGAEPPSDRRATGSSSHTIGVENGRHGLPPILNASQQARSSGTDWCPTPLNATSRVSPSTLSRSVPSARAVANDRVTTGRRFDAVA